MRLLVLADTHLRADTVARLPASVWAMVDEADAVLHAGDVVDAALLDALGERVPVHAVLGNNDHGLHRRLPVTLQLDLEGATVGMIHDAGPRAGRGARMARRFPSADVVVFGHSHEPLIEQVVGGPLLLNPGSPTQRRRQPVHTAAWLEVGGGAPPRAALVEVGSSAD